MFIFKYQVVGKPEWHSKAGKPYQTIGNARRAADRWATVMRNEGCHISTKCFELVSDGRGGMIEGREA